MKHILFTLRGCTKDLLNDEEYVRDVVYSSSRKCKSTLLALNSHKFDPQGVTCIAMLAESHISIHSWPEHEYAAIDIFMCGETEPHRAVNVIRNAFQPERVEIGEHQRGRL